LNITKINILKYSCLLFQENKFFSKRQKHDLIIKILVPFSQFYHLFFLALGVVNVPDKFCIFTARPAGWQETVAHGSAEDMCPGFQIRLVAIHDHRCGDEPG
jgi:hypothetical protein